MVSALPSHQREYPCLIVTGPEGRTVRHLIRGREATVGRERTNDVCIPDPLVSKQHAKIIVANHSVTVFDLGSANKTRVNGQIVAQAAVGYGDEIQFARVKCRLVLARAPAGREPTELDPVLSP
jgi:pSer/pThr/pTyr-binding forkhead associated (FHA) protein